MKMTKSELHEKFTSSEEVLGVYYGDYNSGVRREEFTGDMEYFEECALLPNGTNMSCCTNSAVHICQTLGYGDIYGFSTEDNPVEHSEVSSCGGHDFAVIHSRYIVDPWISLFTGCLKQGVFDLKDPKDAAMIRSVYGDPAKWSLRAYTTQLRPENWARGRPDFLAQTDPSFPPEKRFRSRQKSPVENSLSLKGH